MRGFSALASLLLVLVFTFKLDLVDGQIGAVKTKPTYAQLQEIWGILYRFRSKNPEFGPMQLRIAFHSCIGGCDGCVDMTHPENQGFEQVVEWLEQLQRHDKIFPYMSMADLIAFAVLPNLYSGINRQNRNCQRFKDCATPTPSNFTYFWGRKDRCDKINSTNSVIPHGMPNSMMSTEEMYNWFDKSFKLSRREVVALLGGAHAMGTAHLKNTGYKGTFTKKGMYGITISNQVFRRLTLPNYRDIRVQPNFPNSTVNKRHQYNCFGSKGGLNGIMLPSEVVATHNLNPDPLKEIDCKLSSRFVMRSRRKRTEAEVQWRNELQAKRSQQQFCSRTKQWYYAYIYGRSSLMFIDEYFNSFVKMLGFVPHQQEPLQMLIEGDVPKDFPGKRKNGHVRPYKYDVHFRNRTNSEGKQRYLALRMTKAEAEERIAKYENEGIQTIDQNTIDGLGIDLENDPTVELDNYLDAYPEGSYVG